MREMRRKCRGQFSRSQTDGLLCGLLREGEKGIGILLCLMERSTKPMPLSREGPQNPGLQKNEHAQLSLLPKQLLPSRRSAAIGTPQESRAETKPVRAVWDTGPGTDEKKAEPVEIAQSRPARFSGRAEQNTDDLFDR